MLLALKTGALSFVLFATIFWPLERMFPAREGQRWLRPAWGCDALFFIGQHLLFGLLALQALVFIDGAVQGLSLDGIRGTFASQPMTLQAVEVVLLGDVVVYWFHRACHRFAILWRFHAIHHSSEHLDWLAAYREHPVDGLLTQFAINAPAILLGFPLEAIAWLMAFRGVWALFIHSNVRLPLGPLRVLFGAPELHHWHHLRSVRSQNFANLAPWTDLLFGTYHHPKGSEDWELGLVDELPKDYLGLLISPLKPAPVPVAATSSSAAPGP